MYFSDISSKFDWRGWYITLWTKWDQYWWTYYWLACWMFIQPKRLVPVTMLHHNYHPVSLLCVLSKVYEKVMYNRLIRFLEDFNILFENQFGFRKLHSSYMALMVLTDKLIKSLEKGEFVIGVYLDFSKAFDTVDHVILLSKLSHYGVRGNAL